MPPHGSVIQQKEFLKTVQYNIIARLHFMLKDAKRAFHNHKRAFWDNHITSKNGVRWAKVLWLQYVWMKKNYIFRLRSQYACWEFFSIYVNNLVYWVSWIFIYSKNLSHESGTTFIEQPWYRQRVLKFSNQSCSGLQHIQVFAWAVNMQFTH